MRAQLMFSTKWGRKSGKWRNIRSGWTTAKGTGQQLWKIKRKIPEKVSKRPIPHDRTMPLPDRAGCVHPCGSPRPFSQYKTMGFATTIGTSVVELNKHKESLFIFQCETSQVKRKTKNEEWAWKLLAITPTGGRENYSKKGRKDIKNVSYWNYWNAM